MAKWISSYWPGVLFSTVAHLLLVTVLSWSWQSSSIPEVRTPRYIKATLVELESKAAIEPSDRDKVNLAEQRRQQAAAEKERRRQLEREKKARTKSKQEKKAKAKQAQIAREQARREQQRQQQLAQQQAVVDDLAREKERLIVEEQARTDEAISQSYSALIAARIEQNWSRPPSARRGMQCELEIRMVPTGDVIDVKVTKSSGNVAFDRSAIQAVKKIERFNEVKDIPSRIFEQYFRTFKLSFNPKDLQL